MKLNLMGAVFVLLLGLKLAGIITWSWWLITAPLWAGLAVYVSIFIGAFVFFVVQDIMLKRRQRGWRNKRTFKQ